MIFPSSSYHLLKSLLLYVSGVSYGLHIGNEVGGHTSICCGGPSYTDRHLETGVGKGGSGMYLFLISH